MDHRLRCVQFCAICFCTLATMISVTVQAFAGDSSLDAILERGETIYASSCADCHGSDGQGDASAYEKPLAGDLSIGQLAEIISETMPEGEPEECVTEDAEAVATFIHQAFYSEAARIRNRPPRVDLARLTATQLRQSIADLYAHFEGLPKPDEAESGLSAEYYAGSRRRKESLKIERVDRELNFDFGKESPGEGIEPDEFVIVWRGGIIAQESGRYEIIVRSTCSFVCDLGAYDREFINNHVQSGDKTEFRRSIVLTAGRIYPFELELVQRKRKTENPPAEISLAWVPPGGVEEILPSRNLTSARVPATFSLQTMLPPDDRSYGFERGIAINREWDESTTAAALEFAQIANDELWPSYRRRHRDDKDEDRSVLKGFLAEIVETAFRAPLDAETRAMYVDRQVEQEADDADAIKRVLLLALKSPRFLYPELGAFQSESQRAASALALGLFDSLPINQRLQKAAENNALKDENQIRNYARANVDDYRVRAKMRDMLHQWLNVEHIGEITKSPELFPEFDEALVSDLRQSLDAYLDEIVWSEKSDFRTLFRSDWQYTSDRIAQFYGDAWKPAEDGGGLRKTAPSPNGFGLLTHPYLMSGLAYHDSTSPIHRGVFLIRYMLGRTLQPPQDAFSPLSPDLHPDLTTRERVSLQTSPDSCQVCHIRINGLGFTLENYDAVGRFRAEERGKKVDSQGSYTNRVDELVEFKGPAELSIYLSESDDSHRAFVSRAFQHFVKQPPAAFGADTLDQLTKKFQESEFCIRDLIVEIAVVAASAKAVE